MSAATEPLDPATLARLRAWIASTYSDEEERERWEAVLLRYLDGTDRADAIDRGWTRTLGDACAASAWAREAVRS